MSQLRCSTCFQYKHRNNGTERPESLWEKELQAHWCPVCGLKRPQRWRTAGWSDIYCPEHKGDSRNHDTYQCSVCGLERPPPISTDFEANRAHWQALGWSRLNSRTGIKCPEHREVDYSAKECVVCGAECPKAASLGFVNRHQEFNEHLYSLGWTRVTYRDKIRCPEHSARMNPPKDFRCVVCGEKRPERLPGMTAKEKPVWLASLGWSRVSFINHIKCPAHSGKTPQAQ